MSRLRILSWAAFTLAVCLTPARAAEKPPAAPPGYAKAVDSVANSYVDAGLFSGAILVAKDGKPILRKGYGLANREWSIPATPETRFRLGSITKQFTATAILQLAEQDKLGLDDPITKYYPQAPASWAPITLKHLLTHTSGIPSYTSLPGFFGKLSRVDRTPEEIVALTQDKPLEFTPGAKFNYDNTGYILLGYVIEKVSGQTYAAYLQDHIFGPLGLKNTGYDDSETILPQRAAGYTVTGGKPRNTPYLAMSLPYAAGSLYSTADDLLAWQQALQSGKILKPASVAAMFTDQGFGYGYGQFISKVNGRRMWAHAGGINGFSTDLVLFPDQGLSLVILSNNDQAPIDRLFDRLSGFYFDPAMLADAAPPSAKDTAGYVGAYRMTPSLTLTVTRGGGRLFAQFATQKFELRHEVGATYFVPSPRLTVTFGKGAPSPQITVRQGAKDTVAKRIG
ncbi:serine hydrolase [Phenylobacterium sp.]|uniref:serine hydrolase n=1 Tax=Phenylobacterium sp. TaxID=1871053 RepID=UPI0035670205